MLLNIYKHHHSATLFMFCIVMSMSSARSIYVVSIWAIFRFHFHFIWSYNLIKTGTLTFLTIFIICRINFWMITLINKANTFQKTKVQPQFWCCWAFPWIFAIFSRVLLIKKECILPVHNGPSIVIPTSIWGLVTLFLYALILLSSFLFSKAETLPGEDNSNFICMQRALSEKLKQLYLWRTVL